MSQARHRGAVAAAMLLAASLPTHPRPAAAAGCVAPGSWTAPLPLADGPETAAGHPPASARAANDVSLCGEAARGPAGEDGVALALSGGGYRAMMFHLGALWRLNEIGYLPRLQVVSSVSAGSIVAAHLGLRWEALDFDDVGVARNFVFEVAVPLFDLAQHTIDLPSILKGKLGPGRPSDRLAARLEEHLFGEATLEELPDRPVVVLNATNLQSGLRWSFRKACMGDPWAGVRREPDERVSRAVTASAAFPGGLSPAEFRFEAGELEGLPLGGGREVCTQVVFLGDGGIIDNLGLSDAFFSARTLLISNAGGLLTPVARPSEKTLAQAFRAWRITNQQPAELRVEGFFLWARDVGKTASYWGMIPSRVDEAAARLYGCDPVVTPRRLAQTPTRLAEMDRIQAERIVNLGYWTSDMSLRSEVDPGLPAPAGLPFPATGCAGDEKSTREEAEAKDGLARYLEVEAPLPLPGGEREVLALALLAPAAVELAAEGRGGVKGFVKRALVENLEQVQRALEGNPAAGEIRLYLGVLHELEGGVEVGEPADPSRLGAGSVAAQVCVDSADGKETCVHWGWCSLQ